MHIKKAILWPRFKHVLHFRMSPWPKISKHAASSWYWLWCLLVAMKMSCSEIRILMWRGGFSCYCQGWFDVSFVCSGIFSCRIIHSAESLQMSMYVYKATFSWCICSNYNRAAWCWKCYPSIISQRLWAHPQKQNHTHTKQGWVSHT